MALTLTPTLTLTQPRPQPQPCGNQVRISHQGEEIVKVPQRDLFSKWASQSRVE